VASAVAVGGDTLVVGAPGALVSNVNVGAAYIFNLSSCSLLGTLSEPTPNAYGNFGRSVALSAGRVLIGAPGLLGLFNPNPVPGTAYLFHTQRAVLVTISNPNGTTGHQSTY